MLLLALACFQVEVFSLGTLYLYLTLELLVEVLDFLLVFFLLVGDLVWEVEVVTSGEVWVCDFPDAFVADAVLSRVIL